MMHHTLGTGDFSVFARMFERVTAAQAYLRTDNAAAEIDRVLTVCLRRKQPIYISLPADVASATIEAPTNALPASDYASDPNALVEALETVVELLDGAERPAVLADVGVDRYRMQGALRSLLDATGYPWATMTMGKGVLEETHTQFIGLYDGAMSDDYVRTRIEDADCILTIGTLLTDFNTGGFSAKLDPGRTIEVRGATMRIRRALYEKVAMRDVLPALAGRLRHRGAEALDVRPATARLDRGFIEPFVPEAGVPITQRRLWQRLSSFLEEGDVVLAEAGTALFGAAMMPLPPGVTFVSQLLWASIGYTLGAMVGTSMAAPHRRSVLLIGDGALQFTAQELSTAFRHGLAPIVLVLDNDGYTIERVIRGATQAYNDIQPWRYHRLPELFGGNGLGSRVSTEDELDQALVKAGGQRDQLSVIDVVLDRMDYPDLLHKIGSAAAAMNR
jgi:pyruvate decarboxylase/indolepyruvate decarboxylase